MSNATRILPHRHRRDTQQQHKRTWNESFFPTTTTRMGVVWEAFWAIFEHVPTNSRCNPETVRLGTALFYLLLKDWAFNRPAIKDSTWMIFQSCLKKYLMIESRISSWTTEEAFGKKRTRIPNLDILLACLDLDDLRHHTTYIRGSSPHPSPPSFFRSRWSISGRTRNSPVVVGSNPVVSSRTPRTVHPRSQHTTLRYLLPCCC